jgi:hypothetical protein
LDAKSVAIVEEGRRKKEEGRRKKEEGRIIFTSSFSYFLIFPSPFSSRCPMPYAQFPIIND